jgi:hypothetical protein
LTRCAAKSPARRWNAAERRPRPPRPHRRSRRKSPKAGEKDVVRAGEDAAREVGVIGIPKKSCILLGELKYRTSYGQNVLKHSTEMAHIAGIIAEELGANVKTPSTPRWSTTWAKP